jgi:hypothetical protein
MSPTLRMTLSGLVCVAALAAVFFSVRAFARAKADSGAAPLRSATLLSAACDQAVFRNFDFWLGSWVVRNPEGKEIGQSEIARVASGCAIRESWASATGNTGTSINYYDTETRRWHQHWVGSDGAVLHLAGGIEGNAMILSGESKQGDEAVANRILWTRMDDGRIRQEWSTTSSGGQDWKTIFVGLYQRR